MNANYIVADDIMFPNIIIERRYFNNEFAGYRMTAEDGYVFYDTTENEVIIDPDTIEEIPVTYYYTLSYLPGNYNFDNFPWVAVPRDSVDENLIFGSDPKHEVI